MSVNSEKSKRPILVWAIKHWNGGIYADTVRRTRKEAIEAFVSQFVPRGKSWKSESEYGVHRAIRVEVKIWEGH
jgi:hypothetical protein